MKNLSLTVIIPTYNRKDILRKCLNALFDQTYPQSDYEVIIVDDGSTDGTEEIVKFLINSSPCILGYFKQKHKGPAAARNLAIKNTRGRIILFLDDDSIAIPALLKEHMTWHKRYFQENIAILGYATWSHELKCTPLMKWLDKGGPQFHYWKIEGKKTVDYKYFYTCNVSLKTDFLRNNGLFFDEHFQCAAYEDIELGHRLEKNGMVLKYSKKAKVYHYHYTSLRDACKRMIKVGEASQIYQHKLDSKSSKYSENQNSLRNSSTNLLKYLLRKAKFVIYYLLAKHYEKRKIKSHIFEYI